MTARAVAAARAFAGDAVEVGGDPLRATGRLFVVSSGVPRLSAAHFAAAVLDLDGGADVSFGSALDGGAYLVAMRSPRPSLLERVLAEPDPSGLARALAAAGEAGLEVGLLRMERRLRDPADAAAMLADPLLPAEVRDLLGGQR